ncbi:MAG: aldehyde oxidoreductase [bacterium]|jgi:CO/xanthine dehydrogenase Mo-binding subunit/aerobic-type carbon monoxide dehydrogenase small subunit (CoxS/CutS family)
MFGRIRGAGLVTTFVGTKNTHAVLSSIPGPVRLLLNGKPVSVEGGPSQRLSAVLRDQLGTRDVKIGCNAGDCGACTVLVDGDPVCSCLTAICQVSGKQVDTLAGLKDSDPIMQQLMRSFLVHGAAQCGICTPGMLVTAVYLLRQTPHPSVQQVQDSLGGVLCRCTGYRKIIDAVVNSTGVAISEGASTGCRSESSKCKQSVGVSIQRLDGQSKVDGSDQFGDDVFPDNAFLLRLIRSPHHRASFHFGDFNKYIDEHSGIHSIFTADDIPGSNRFGVIPPFIDQPVFAESIARFKGEAVAAVVGDADAMEQLNLDAFPITWTEERALLNPVEALADDNLRVHENAHKNVLCEGLVQCGDVETAFGNSHLRVKGRFTTGFIEHAYIEPEAGYANRVGDSLEVYGCTQAPYMDRDSLSEILALEPARVRIVPTSTGGGFGSKLDLSFQPFIALAAWLLDHPVRVTYTRQESMQSTTKRHPSIMDVDIAVDATGRISAFKFEGVFNTGAYASWGPTVANRVPVHASGPYWTPNYRAHTTGVYTHSAPAGAFRGFGVPQAAIAQECVFDELAEKLAMDRLAFRKLNALDNNQPTVTGQTFDKAVGIKACLESLELPWATALLEASQFNQKAQATGSSVRRGVGIASGWYGCGNTSLANPSTIKVGVSKRGDICLHQGAVDIGQGSNTVIIQIFAEAFGVSVDNISLVGADTAITPDAGKTSASRQTFVSGNAAKLSALALRKIIARRTNCKECQSIDIEGSVITINQGLKDEANLDLASLPSDEEGYVFKAEESYNPPTKPLDENGQGIPYALYGYAAQMVSLDVDTLLGTVKLQYFTAAHDVGRAINPQLVEGQIHGGIAQGIGLALMEEFIPGRTENLHDYLIPTIGDVPPIETIIVEVEDPHGPYGAKGLGEHVLIPTAPAILNAITHACGAKIRDLPATPDKVLAAIHSNTEGC